MPKYAHFNRQKFSAFLEQFSLTFERKMDLSVVFEKLKRRWLQKLVYST